MNFLKKYYKSIGLIIIGILLGIGSIIILMNVGTTNISLKKIGGDCYADTGNHLLKINADYENTGTETPLGLWAEVTYFDPAVIVSSITPIVAFPYLPPGSSASLTFEFILVDPFVATSTSVILKYHWYEPLTISPFFREHTRDDTLTCDFSSR